MTINGRIIRFIYRVMGANNRYGLLAVIVFLLAIFSHSYAQKTPPANSQTLYLQGRLSLDSLTNYVHTHTGIRFSFNSGKIKSNTIIPFPKGAYTINRILQHLQQVTGLYHFSYKSYIIFQEKPFKTHIPVTAATHRSAISTHYSTPATHHLSSTPRPLIKAAGADTLTFQKNTPAITPTVSLPASTASPDTIPQLHNISAAYSTNTDVEKSIIRNTDDSSIRLPFAVRYKDTLPVIRALQKLPVATNTPAPPALPIEHNKRFHPYVQAGVFATEVLYANAGIELGFRPVHLLFSWGTDFHINGPRIGIGSIIKTNESSHWEVNATICFLQTNYAADSAGVSHVLFTVKGRLYSTGANWCKQLDAHWLFKAGLSLNLLSTTYYKDGVKAPLEAWLFNTDVDKALHLLKYPWLVTNSFNRLSAGNIKTWPGLYIGFYYTL